MNCRQGDLAVIVRSMAGNEGQIVRCVRLALAAETRFPPIFDGPRWLIDRELKTAAGRSTITIADSVLRPIRGQTGDDETLTWAGKPEQVPA